MSKDSPERVESVKNKVGKSRKSNPDEVRLGAKMTLCLEAKRVFFLPKNIYSFIKKYSTIILWHITAIIYPHTPSPTPSILLCCYCSQLIHHFGTMRVPTFLQTIKFHQTKKHTQPTQIIFTFTYYVCTFNNML
jgi:hypothetical protein